MSLLYGFPSAVAAELKWSIEDVVSAHRRLCEQLRGHIHEFFTNPQEAIPHGLGVRIPDHIKF